MRVGRLRPVKSLRDALGRRVHAIIDARIAERWPAIEAGLADHLRQAALREHQTFGPPERLHLAPTAEVNDALFNTVSGSITVADYAFFGHGVAILTGAHDIEQLGTARRTAIPLTGRDIEIGAGAWVASRAMVLGPCRIGENAVVCAGAVVTADVGAGIMVAGNPARPIRSLGSGIPSAVDVELDVGRMYLHSHDEVITPDLIAARGMLDSDMAELRALATKGVTVVDVGANIGYATLIAARAGAAVVAIEPHPFNVALLRANVARHGADVTVVAGAAWHTTGQTTLAVCRSNSGDHRAGTVITGRVELHVAAVRIDDVVPANASVSVIKLDTQATEHLALAGASETLDRCRPVLLVEFWPQGIRERGGDPTRVLAGYANLGYGRRVVEDQSLDSAADETLITKVHERPAPFGGFVTLRLDPLE